MKMNRFFARGMSAVLLTFGLVLAGCGNASTTGGGDPALTGSVSIPGFIKVDQAATAITSALGGTGTISYQWETSDTENGTFAAVTGATSDSYTPDSADEDRWLRVTVTRAGYTGSKSSHAVQVRDASVDPPTVTSVTVSPPTASVAKGATQTFTAAVYGTNSPA